MRPTIGHLVMRHVRLSVLAAPLALLVPADATAQRVHTPPTVVVNATTRDNARADTLDRWAESMYGTRWQWPRAARLHERAAALRGDDPRAVQSWRMAAWLYGATGDHGRGRTMMERAAESAAAGGDVERAANAYIDAALIAMEDGRADKATGLLRRTRVVLGSPLLPLDRRGAILRRIGEEPRLAQAYGTP
jgi:hypothetical protein